MKSLTAEITCTSPISIATSCPRMKRFYFRKGLFLLTLMLSLFFFKAEASHLMGGEITWACQGSGKYIFTLKLYRDCNGTGVPSSIVLSVFNNPSVTSINLTNISQTDISPVCNGAGPAITCAAASADTANYNAGAVQENVFQSLAITLSGIPPPQGWAFIYSDCCRNGAVSNLQNASTDGFTLRATMYSYNGQNADPCFDSSPTFLESPSTVICLGYPFNYNHNAYDRDLDSLSFSFAEPLDKLGSGSYLAGTNPAPLPFTNGYSYNSPLPGTIQNPANIPAVINHATGEVSFTSFTQGYFVTVVKVQSWKCGILVAEIFREIEVVLLPCAVNAMPTVTYTSYQSTVPAGTLVSFTLNGHDSGVLTDGVTPQSVTINASGTQFGAGFTNAAAGCLHPPCATLSSSLPVSAPTNIATTFNWQTSCNHISYNTICNTISNTYTFVFRVKDDFCPAPSENISTVSITVLATRVVQSLKPHCVCVLRNGDVTVTWSVPSDTAHTFNGYFIYTSASHNGPFTLLDSVLTYNSTGYTHIGANANAAAVYYYIRTRSGCFGQVLSPPVDTISSMYLQVINPSNGTAVLSWNSIASPNIPTSTGIYTIYQEHPVGTWTAIGSTTHLNFIDTVFLCNATLNFKVEIADDSGCVSTSSINGGTFQNTIVPFSPVFDTLSVDNSNKALMSWNIDPAPDVTKYIIYKLVGGAKIPIDTVFGINNTWFNYLSSNAGAGSETYYLAAVDSCGNISPLGNPFNTIFLTSSPEICLRSVVLNWTAYPTIGTGLAAYRVYLSTVGLTGPYTLYAIAPPGTLTDTVKSLN